MMENSTISTNMEEPGCDVEKLYEAIIEGNLDELKTLKRMEFIMVSVSKRHSCMHGNCFEMSKRLNQMQLDMLKRGLCECLEECEASCAMTYGVSLLHFAIHSKDPAPVIEYLVNDGCNINAQTLQSKWSVLHSVLDSSEYSEEDKLARVGILLHHGYDVLMKDAKHRTLFHHCIKHRQENVLLYLLQHTKLATLLNQQDIEGASPLLLAAKCRSRIAHMLLDHDGIDINLPDNYKITPLFSSIEARTHNLTYELLNRGADVNPDPVQSRRYILCTPLLFAVERTDFQLVTKLLELGADPNQSNDQDPMPPLMIATYSRATPIAKLLLKHGADINRTNSKGYGPIHIAAWNGFDDLVTLFMSHGVAFDCKTADGNTPFSLACHGNKLSIARCLLPHAPAVNNSDKDRDTPIHYASYNGCLDTVKALIEHGATPDVRNRFDVTPLWNAAYIGHLEMLRLLLRHNPDLHIRSVGIRQDADDNDVQHCFSTPKSVTQVAALSARTGGVSTERSHAAVRILLYAGAGRGSSQGTNQSPNQPQPPQSEAWLYESPIFRDVLSDSLSLLLLCRAAIRDFLRPLPGSLKHQVQQMDIPETLKAYLMTDSLIR
jgi:ankyrin repeat protein